MEHKESNNDGGKMGSSLSIKRFVKSFGHAIDGIKALVKNEANFRIHLFIGALVIVFAFYFNLNPYEWCILLICIGLVLMAEAFNTAIEHLIDLISPEIHPLAKSAKDVAAAAVLLISIFAAIVGLIIFIPHLYNLIKYLLDLI